MGASSPVKSLMKMLVKRGSSFLRLESHFCGPFIIHICAILLASPVAQTVSLVPFRIRWRLRLLACIVCSPVRSRLVVVRVSGDGFQYCSIFGNRLADTCACFLLKPMSQSPQHRSLANSPISQSPSQTLSTTEVRPILRWDSSFPASAPLSLN